MAERYLNQRNLMIEGDCAAPQSDPFSSQVATPTATSFGHQVGHSGSPASPPRKPIAFLDFKDAAIRVLNGGSAAITLEKKAYGAQQTRRDLPLDEAAQLHGAEEEMALPAALSEPLVKQPVFFEKAPDFISPNTDQSNGDKQEPIEDSSGAKGGEIPIVAERATLRLADSIGKHREDPSTRVMLRTEAVHRITIAAESQDSLPPPASMSGDNDYVRPLNKRDSGTKESEHVHQQKSIDLDNVPKTSLSESDTISFANPSAPDDQLERARSVQIIEPSIDIESSATMDRRELSPLAVPLPEDDDLDLMDQLPETLPPEISEPMTTDALNDENSYTDPMSTSQAAFDETSLQDANVPRFEQETEDDLFAFTAKKKGKKGKKTKQVPNLVGEHVDTEPAIIDAPVAGSEQIRDLGVAAPHHQPETPEDEWAVPISKKKGKKGKKMKQVAGFVSGTVDTESTVIDAPVAGSEQTMSLEVAASPHQPKTPEDGWAVPISKKRGKKGKRQRSEPDDLPAANQKPAPVVPVNDTPVSTGEDQHETRMSRASQESDGPVVSEVFERERIPTATSDTAAAVNAILAAQSERKSPEDLPCGDVLGNKTANGSVADKPADEHDVDLAVSEKQKDRNNDLIVAFEDAAATAKADELLLQPTDVNVAYSSTRIPPDDPLVGEGVQEASNSSHDGSLHTTSSTQSATPSAAKNIVSEESDAVPVTGNDVGNASLGQLVEPTQVSKPKIEAEFKQDSVDEEKEEQISFPPPKSKKNKKKAKKAKAVGQNREGNPASDYEPAWLAENTAVATVTASVPFVDDIAEPSSKANGEETHDVSVPVTEDFSVPAKRKKEKKKTKKFKASVPSPDGGEFSQHTFDALGESTPVDQIISPVPFETTSGHPSGTATPEPSRAAELSNEFAIPKSKQEKKREKKSRAFDIEQDDLDLPADKPRPTDDLKPVDLGATASQMNTSSGERIIKIDPEAKRKGFPDKGSASLKSKEGMRRPREDVTSLLEDDVAPPIKERNSLSNGTLIHQEPVQLEPDSPNEANSIPQGLRPVEEKLQTTEREKGEKIPIVATTFMPKDEAETVSNEQLSRDLDPRNFDNVGSKHRGLVMPGQSEEKASTPSDVLSTEKDFPLLRTKEDTKNAEQAATLSFDEAGPKDSKTDNLAETDGSDKELLTAFRPQQSPLEHQEAAEQPSGSKSHVVEAKEDPPLTAGAEEAALTQEDVPKEAPYLDAAAPTVEAEPDSADTKELGLQYTPLEHKNRSLPQNAASAEDGSDQIAGFLNNQPIVGEKSETDINVKADASTSARTTESRKDKKQSNRAKTLESEGETVKNEPLVSVDSELSLPYLTSIDEPPPGDILSKEPVMAGEAEIVEIPSQRKSGEEVTLTEVDSPQGETLEGSTHGKALDPHSQTSGGFGECIRDSEDENLAVEEDRGKDEATGMIDVREGPTEKSQTSKDIDEKPVEVALAPQVVGSNGGKGVDGGSEVPAKTIKKNKKKGKSVKITSEDPKIIADYPVTALEPSEPPPVDTPLSVGSVDLLDAEAQREYNEEYARELERQLRGDADRDSIGQQSYEPALSASAVQDMAPPSSPKDWETSVRNFKPTKKGRKGKKNKKQQPIIWEDDTATKGIVPQAGPEKAELQPSSRPLDLEEPIEHETQEPDSAVFSTGGSPSLVRGSRGGEGNNDYFGIQPLQNAEQDVGGEGSSDRCPSSSTGAPDLDRNSGSAKSELLERRESVTTGQQPVADGWGLISAKESKIDEEPTNQELQRERSAPSSEAERHEAEANISQEVPYIQKRSNNASSASQHNSSERSSQGEDTIRAITELSDSNQRAESTEIASAAAIGIARTATEGLSRKASKREKERDKKRREAGTWTEDDVSKQDTLVQPGEQPGAGQEPNTRDQKRVEQPPSASPPTASLLEPSETQPSVHTLPPSRNDPQFRDGGMHVSNSPTFQESKQMHRVWRDRGYLDTEMGSSIDEEAEGQDQNLEREIIDSYKNEPKRHRTFSEYDLIDSYHDRPGERSSPDRQQEHFQQYGPVADEPLQTTPDVDDDHKVATPEARAKRRRSRRASRGAYDSDDSADSGFDVQKRRRRLEALAEEQCEPSPVSSTTKNRSSVLFDSSPSGRDGVRGERAKHTGPAHSPVFDPSMGESFQYEHGKSNPEPNWSFRALEGNGHEQSSSIFGGPSHADDGTSRSRSPSSNDRCSRRALITISERSTEHLPGSLDRSRGRNTDRVSSRHNSNTSTKTSILPIATDFPSQGIASPDSIHAIIRTPDKVRSASGQSSRSSGTPPLRRVDRSTSGDLRGASRQIDAKIGAKIGAKISEEAEPYISIPSSSTYDPLVDKGKNKADMAHYVSVNAVLCDFHDDHQADKFI